MVINPRIPVPFSTRGRRIIIIDILFVSAVWFKMVTLGISIIATPGSLEILEIGGPVGSRLYDHQLYSSFPHGLPERITINFTDRDL